MAPNALHELTVSGGNFPARGLTSPLAETFRMETAYSRSYIVSKITSQLQINAENFARALAMECEAIQMVIS